MCTPKKRWTVEYFPTMPLEHHVMYDDTYGNHRDAVVRITWCRCVFFLSFWDYLILEFIGFKQKNIVGKLGNIFVEPHKY